MQLIVPTAGSIQNSHWPYQLLISQLRQRKVLQLLPVSEFLRLSSEPTKRLENEHPGFRLNRCLWQGGKHTQRPQVGLHGLVQTPMSTLAMVYGQPHSPFHLGEAGTARYSAPSRPLRVEPRL